jgi:hypothetical protein
MTLTTRTISTLIALVAAFAVAALTLSAGPADAIVPPKDCKTIKVKGKRYNIKADQIKCTTARDYAGDYLRSRQVHRRWKCYSYKYTSTNHLVLKCVNTRSNPDKTIWAYRK